MIRLINLGLHLGAFRLKDASMEVPTGAYGVLMGKTGSGKTTILEAIAGLKPAMGGQIWLGGRNVTRLKPAARNVGYVPQEGALFSTMSVRDQIGFALSIRKYSRQEIDARVAELADLLDISGLLDRFPRGLSGGERQRIALGRALAFRPTTLLLDEPLSALDDETREKMYDLLLKIREQAKVTTLHVTHSRQEALRLGDRMYRVDAGQIVEQPLPGLATAEEDFRGQALPEDRPKRERESPLDA